MKKNCDELVSYMRVARAKGIGPVTFHHMINIYKDINLCIERIEKKQIKNQKIKNSILPSIEEIKLEIKMTNEVGAIIIPCYDKLFPQLLKKIHGYPPILTAIGDFAALNKTCISVIGSRNASTNGKRFTDKLITDLAEHDLCIVSGLALGIDAAAHESALKNNLSTIGIIGCGIDKIYPWENRELFTKIKKKGLIITEFPLGQSAKPQHFPQRNRLISGISKGTLIMEATFNSGSLMTARYALEQNRAIFAVPGFPTDPRHQGTNKLIKQGAIMVCEYEDILFELNNFQNYQAVSDILNKNNMNINKNINLMDELENIKEKILAVIDYSIPVSVDEIIQTTTLQISIVTVALLELEIEGLIENISGKYIKLI